MELAEAKKAITAAKQALVDFLEFEPEGLQAEGICRDSYEIDLHVTISGFRKGNRIRETKVVCLNDRLEVQSVYCPEQEEESIS